MESFTAPPQTLQMTEREQSAAGNRIFGFAGLAAFCCGALSSVFVDIGGQLYGAEIALPIAALICRATGSLTGLWGQQRFRVLIVCIAMMMVGYMASDLIAGTSPVNYLRGWSRVAILASDFVALTSLALHSRWNLWWYWLGSALYVVIYGAVQHHPLAEHWKMEYGDAFAFLAATLGVLLPRRMQALLLLGLGALTILLDHRSLGAILILVGGILAFGRVRKSRERSIARILVASVGVAMALTVTFFLVNYSQGEYLQRREMSNIGRVAALRVGVLAIARSPFIGYGSWGQGTEEFAEIFNQDTRHDMISAGANQVSVGQSILAHSQIIQAWMEGGMLAAAFFIAYGSYIVRSLYGLVFKRGLDVLAPLALLLLLIGLWHLFMSPFLGGHRLIIASTAALVCSMARAAVEPPGESARTEVRIRLPVFPNLMQ